MLRMGWLKGGLLPKPEVSLYDLALAVALVVGGLAYHWDFEHWSIGLVGGVVYGDAEFWWDGALHVAEGNIRHHPGLGMRPGFFVGAGLTIPVLGASVPAFHKFLLALFLGSAVSLYLSLRGPLGRLGASCGALLLVFNPYLAQWLATPTTDGLGLVLHLLSLCLLLTGTAAGPRLGRLAGFGLLFALGTLTRPIITPFIGLAVLGLLLSPGAAFRKRALAAAVVVVAYCVPTLLWLVVQHSLVGEWAISNNDAGTYYAASDPNIQVWNPTMFEPVRAEARQRLGRPPTLAEENAVFRRQAAANFRKHFQYHLDRGLPHLWAVASPVAWLSPEAIRWRALFLAGLAGGLCCQLLSRRQWLRSAVLLAAGVSVWLSPHTAGFLIVAGVALACVGCPARDAGRGRVHLAAYWLCGVAALFVVGGTYGPPLPYHTQVTLNALGHRLGTQFFFAGDLLAVVCLVQLATLNVLPAAECPAAAAKAGPLRRALAALLTRPSALAGGLVHAAACAGLAAVVLIYAGGAVLIVRRHQAEREARRTPLPDAAAVVGPCTQAAGHSADSPLPVAPSLAAVWKLLPPDRHTGASGDFIALGQVGPLVWNVGGERRTLARFHAQCSAPPYLRDGRVLTLQFAEHLPPEQWAGAKGAFVLRALPDALNHEIQPAYYNALVVRAFVPLTPDRTGYDLERLVRFSAALCASQLHALGLLRCQEGAIDWTLDSGLEGRRVTLLPQARGETGRAVLQLDPTRLSGGTTLSLGYRWGAGGGQGMPGLRVEGRRRDTGERVLLWSDRESASAAGPGAELRMVSVELPDTLASVELTWDCPAPTTPVWVYELVVRAEDLHP
jgi:Dolichyl-phosphate-mannose-protein mannosyltransferase